MDSLKIDLMKLSAAPFIRRSEALTTADSSSGSPGVSFESLLENSMKKINDLQLESESLVNRLATGDVEDVSAVVLSAQRAEFALRMITEVRNKLVDAYQQLGRLPV
ncbi:MAG: flagellar hook-basal body complex protein FliE [Synergistaceae bacterium]|nr:flagellar hook-basal body complex protein FliE [Synergistaceae bacterium]